MLFSIQDKITIKKTNLLSYISIFFIVFYESLKESRLNTEANKIFLLVAFLAFAVQTINRIIISEMNLKKKKVASTLLLSLVFFCIVFQFTTNRDIRLVMSILGIYSALWIDETKIINCVLYSKVIALVLVVITGGYNHINLLAAHSGMIILLYMCKHKNKFNKLKFLLIIVCYVLLCVVSASGSLVIGLGFALLFELILLVFPKTTKKILNSLFVKIFFPICFFSNLLLVICYKTYELPGVLNQLNYPIKRLIYQITIKLNDFFTGRLSLAQFSLREFGYSFLGGDIDSYSNFMYKGHYFNLDSGMIWLLQGSGILVTSVFLITMTLIMISFIKRKEYQYAIALMTISLWGINEDIVRSVGVNFMILFIGKAIVDIFEVNMYNNEIFYRLKQMNLINRK